MNRRFICALLRSRSPFSVRRSGYELLALKDAPDDVLLNQVQVIGERAARHMLFNEAARLQHTDQNRRRRTASP
jgi:hypothetical protein